MRGVAHPGSRNAACDVWRFRLGCAVLVLQQHDRMHNALPEPMRFAVSLWCVSGAACDHEPHCEAQPLTAARKG